MKQLGRMRELLMCLAQREVYRLENVMSEAQKILPASSLGEPAVKWKDLKKNSDGQVPVVVQDAQSGEVLMVAYMNEEAYLTTFKTGRMTYYSRSRQELWIKGDTSGHYQYVKELIADCDKDTILAKVSQVGAACHTGSYSCFFNNLIQ